MCGIDQKHASPLAMREHGGGPTLATLNTVAAALETHPLFLVAAKHPEEAWKQTQYVFDEWKRDLLWNPGSRPEPVRSANLVKVFLARWPEHGYARKKLLKHAFCAPAHDPEIPERLLDASKWQREVAAAKAAGERSKRGQE